MRGRITKRTVDSLKPRRARFTIWDTEVTGFGCRVMPTGIKSYVFQYRTSGAGRSLPAKRITIGRHGDLTLKQARKLAASNLLKVRAGEDPTSERGPRDRRSVADLIKRFLTDYLPNKKRPPRTSTVRFYTLLLRCHVTPGLGRRAVASVTPADVEALHAKMRSRPYAANRTLSTLQQAFDQAERWGWRPRNSNPATYVERYPEPRRGSRKEVLLTPEQMARLLAAIDAEEAAGANVGACNAIRVAFWTGWRIGEVLALQWANLDLKDGRAKLLRTKTAEEEYRRLPSEAIAVIERQMRLADSPQVFPGLARGGSLTSVRKPWGRIRRRAGLNKLEGLGALRVHDLRHNVVSWDVSRGVSLEIAGKNVGHRSRRSTEVYAHFAPDALKRAADLRAEAMRAAVEGASAASSAR
jgi:integrase